MRKLNGRFYIYGIILFIILLYCILSIMTDTPKREYKEECHSLECYSDYVIRNNVGNSKEALEEEFEQ